MTFWTQERRGRLTELWADGQPIGVIAGQLRTTRNAIAGAAHRMGLPVRPSPIPSGTGAPGIGARKPVQRAGASTLPQLPSLAEEASGRPSSRPGPQAKTKQENAPVGGVSDAQPVCASGVQDLASGSVMDPGRAPLASPSRGGARFGCCWVLNGRKPWRYCDAPLSAPDSAWCSYHHAIVYRPAGSLLP